MPGRGYKNSSGASESHLYGQAQRLQPMQKLFHDRLQDAEGRINLLEIIQSPLKIVPLSKVEIHTVGDLQKIRIFPEKDLLGDFNNLTIKVIIHFYDLWSNHIDSRVVLIINNNVRERFVQKSFRIQGNSYQVPSVVHEDQIFFVQFEGRTVVDISLHVDVKKLLKARVLNSAFVRADVGIVENPLYM